MIKKPLMILLAILMIPTLGFALEIGGTVLPDSLKAGKSDLLLNGAGLRKKLFVKVYAGGLYLKGKTSDAEKIITADEPMAIRIQFVYDGVAPGKLIDAWNQGFKNATKDNTAAIQDKINRFNSFFTTEAQKNDVYEIVYVPGEGVTTNIKGKNMGTIKGLDFKKALFGIWLCGKPADKGLKKGMLNK